MKIRVRSKFKHWQLVDDDNDDEDWKSDQTNFWMPAVAYCVSSYSIWLNWLLPDYYYCYDYFFSAVRSSIKRSTVRFHEYVSLIKREKKSIIIFSWSMLFFGWCAPFSSRHGRSFSRTTKAETIRLTCRGINRIQKWILRSNILLKNPKKIFKNICTDRLEPFGSNKQRREIGWHAFFSSRNRMKSFEFDLCAVLSPQCMCIRLSFGHKNGEFNPLFVWQHYLFVFHTHIDSTLSRTNQRYF